MGCSRQTASTWVDKGPPRERVAGAPEPSHTARSRDAPGLTGGVAEPAVVVDRDEEVGVLDTSSTATFARDPGDRTEDLAAGGCAEGDVEEAILRAEARACDWLGRRRGCLTVHARSILEKVSSRSPRYSQAGAGRRVLVSVCRVDGRAEVERRH